jgi:hypothetical protein
MIEYRFECREPDGKVKLSCKVPALSDEHASEVARKLLLETECHQVEVWRETSLIHRASRP